MLLVSVARLVHSTITQFMRARMQIREKEQQPMAVTKVSERVRWNVSE